MLSFGYIARRKNHDEVMNAVFESKNVSQTEQELQTDLQKGLSQQEAKNRLEKNGPMPGGKEGKDKASDVPFPAQ